MHDMAEFGTLPTGVVAHVYTLATGCATARIGDFGATLLGLDVPDARGNLADVVLGFAGLDGYAGENGACFGATVGPVANRTAGGQIEVAGTTYQLARNEHGTNNLHSDLDHGLHKRLWTLESLETTPEGMERLVLSCELDALELGLPGNRRFLATYELSEPSILTLTYLVETDAPTFVNVTNHTYLNLSGHASGSVDAQVVRLDATRFVPVGDTLIPNGELAPVGGTPFDFTEPHALGERVEADCDQIRYARGYDHCFCVDGYEPGAAPRHALTATDPASGRVLDVLITDPGAQLYTGNWLGDRDAKDGADYGPRAGFAVEPEFYPDCAHHEAWPPPVCDPAHPFVSTIDYRFSTEG